MMCIQILRAGILEVVSDVFDEYNRQVSGNADINSTADDCDVKWLIDRADNAKQGDSDNNGKQDTISYYVAVLDSVDFLHFELLRQMKKLALFSDSEELKPTPIVGRGGI